MGLLRILGLIDDSRRPTTLMLGLWGQLTTRIMRSEYHKPVFQAKRTTVLQTQEKQKKPTFTYSIYVGNLDYDTTEEELREFFTQFGNVVAVAIPLDFVTHRGRGFGFVKMSTSVEANYAIEQSNGMKFRERILKCDRDYGR